jgi:hypothetical protein
MPRHPISRCAGILLLLSALTLPALSVRTGAGRARDPLGNVYALHRRIRDIHPAFHQLYPVAVVREGHFYIYEPVPNHWTYRLVKTAPDPYHLPVGIRAAMPLDFWGNRIACVVTPDVFDEPDGYVMIQHEFVHCYQWETCEPRLKETLAVYRQAMARHDFMWELQHPFPYADPAFQRDYQRMLRSLADGDLDHARADRQAIRERLSREDWEYMTWQEWKEGLARYLENAIRARLRLPENRGGAKPPFDRICFYAGGAALIGALERERPGTVKDIEALYHRIAE